MARKKEMCSSKSNEPGAGIVLLKLEELHSFEGHPFKVERNQELFELRCSIEKEGVLVPLLVRKNPHGDGYEIISGHRRKEAALWTGLTKVPVIIRELDDDQSVIAMIDSNLQREKILPSEKAFLGVFWILHDTGYAVSEIPYTERKWWNWKVGGSIADPACRWNHQYVQHFSTGSEQTILCDWNVRKIVKCLCGYSMQGNGEYRCIKESGR